MKIKSKIYATALAEVILKVKSGDERKISENFLRFLKSNGDERKAKEIISMTENIFARKSGKKKVIVEAARKININPIIRSFVKSDDIVGEKINPELIAGVKITVNGEKQMDFSLKTKINNCLTTIGC